MFTGKTYIQYRLRDLSTVAARRKRQAANSRSTLVDRFSFRFRTEQDRGTLFQIGRPSNDSGDYAYVEIATGGLLLYHINLGSGEEVFALPPSNVGSSSRINPLGIDDAEWHFFESNRVALNLTLTVDNVTWSRTLGGDQLYLDVSPSDVYVGGTPFGGGATFYLGCMEDVRIDHQELPTSGSNDIASIVYSGAEGEEAGGVPTGCALRGCFSDPCKMGVCTELGASDYLCSCSDGSTVRSAPCPVAESMMRFRLIIIVSSVVGGLVVALIIFVLSKDTYYIVFSLIFSLVL